VKHPVLQPYLVSVMWFLTSLVCCAQSIIQFGYPYTPDYVGDVPIVTFLFALCPWTLLSKGFNDLGLAAAGTNPGLDWGQRTRCREPSHIPPLCLR
jgi:hypothetical protein